MFYASRWFRIQLAKVVAFAKLSCGDNLKSLTMQFFHLTWPLVLHELFATVRVVQISFYAQNDSTPFRASPIHRLTLPFVVQRRKTNISTSLCNERFLTLGGFTRELRFVKDEQ